MTIKGMATLLRDTSLHVASEWSCVGSMISVLPSLIDKPCSYWFTGTPDPKYSMFKPIIFAESLSLGSSTTVCQQDQCSVEGNTHCLWKKHERFRKLVEEDEKYASTLTQMLDLEQNCFEDIADVVENWDQMNEKKMCNIFEHMCSIELGFY